MSERNDSNNEIEPISATDDADDVAITGATGTDLTGDPASVVLHGIDIVSIDRIASLLAEFGVSFRRRVFTESERAYCETQGMPPQHYAARWAAKEAFYKTLDEESPAVPLDSIEVVRKRTGPQLRLEPPASRALARTLEQKRVRHATADIAVSLTHDRTAGYAVGSVTVFGSKTRHD